MHGTLSSIDSSRLAVTIAVGVGTATAIGLAYLYRKNLENLPPKRWRKVGEISDLICYPIKSCGSIRLKTAFCNELCLEDGHLRDRVFMAITPEGQFITARSQPKLVQIQPRIEGNKMILSAPGMMDHEIDFNRLHTITPIRVTVWQQYVSAVDCGEETAKWMSRFICSDDIGIRLMFYPGTTPTREVRPKNRHYSLLNTGNSGALHDASSYMMVNEGSLAELNSRLDEKVTAVQFRPNFVVKGPVAFEEDLWKWVRIGENVVFRNVKPCTRCIFTNIDPETAARHKEQEPLKTLREYRIIRENEPPAFGIHIAAVKFGSVAVGDSVYVEDDRN
ncbi:hypothetical protein HA402_006273 [Bradysia odoriphaga]|nr:hypothetical protein HA402_006273 [Bradysia odoriphaga]